MRVFVYEFVTGGGWPAVFDHPPPIGLASEGRAIRDALAADLEAIGSVEVLTIAAGLPERGAFAQAARQADFTVIIAPEFGEILATRHRWAAAVGARVLGCNLNTIELATDKQRTAEHLARHGLNVPRGQFLTAGQPLPHDFDYPAVLKPIDGAGSLGIRWIEGPDDLAAAPPAGSGWRLERFCPGMAASVALLCGPNQVEALPACRQLLTGAADPQAPFAYRGGQLPLPPPLDARARRLGQQVAATLGAGTPHGPIGWLGVDLVLGVDATHADDTDIKDTVIEINPRLTTSYLGLRRLARDNLAAALLAIASGETARLSFGAKPLQFAADGSVTELATEIR